MDKLDIQEVKEFYEKVNVVWPENDRWHNVNQREIKKYLHRFSFSNCKILNAGSGGNNYDINVDMYHVDIAENKIKNTKNHVVCSIENMPFCNGSFNVVICVGSVINYCDAVKAIGEMARVLKTNGIIILEFENSYSYEFKNTKAYKSNATVVTTNYFNSPHKMWVYSPDYISSILKINHITTSNIYPFHILSSLSYYNNRDENKAAKYASLDMFMRHIPFLRKHSGNIILFGKKL